MIDHHGNHCRGEFYGNTCRRREQCECYRRHLDAADRGMLHVPYLEHIANLGYGKTYKRDITNGCANYEGTGTTKT